MRPLSPASRLGDLAPAERGAWHGLPRVGASCPGCPQHPWGLLSPQHHCALVQGRLPGCLWGAAGLGLSLPSTARRGRGSSSAPAAAPSGSWGPGDLILPVPGAGAILSQQTGMLRPPLWSPAARMEKQTWWCEALCRVGGCSPRVSPGCGAFGGGGRRAPRGPGAGAAPGPSCSAAGARVRGALSGVN